MSKVFVAVFLIFGTVVGSGFSSGKEIFVFFSRFGAASYLFIFAAGALFFLLFKFLLQNGRRVSQKLKNSAFFNCILGVVSFVFCSSMFAGTSNLFSYFPFAAQLILLAGLIFLCIFSAKRGMSSLKKINFLVMPIVAVLFFVALVVLCCNVENFGDGVGGEAGGAVLNEKFSGCIGVIFCPLYVALNTSTSVVVLANLGKEMNKKQIEQTCFLSVFLIEIFLLLGNFVLQNVDASAFEMPFLSLAENFGGLFYVVFFVILIGCITTLLSLCFTLKCSLEKVVKNSDFCAILSVLLPLLLSLLGFSKIVSILYPVCSVLGIFSLVFLIFQSKKRE